jgi:hypothetical protein
MKTLAISTERKGSPHTALLESTFVSYFGEKVMTEKYLGKICQKHPELNGLRNSSDDRCGRCEVIRSAKRKQKRKEREGVYCVGLICAKHPDLNGKRTSSNGACLGCQNDNKTKLKSKRELSNGVRYFGSICARHVDLKGERYTNTTACIKCNVEYKVNHKVKRKSLGVKWNGVICEDHPELNGLRYTSNNNCIKCNSKKRAARITKQIKSSPIYALMVRIRGSINESLAKNGYTKKSRSHEILGCDWDTFSNHIESQFKQGMNWTNRHLWHLDHIEPISRAVTENDVIRLNHYTNFQPLWAIENLIKSNKYDDADLASKCLPIERGSATPCVVNLSPVYTAPLTPNGLF